MFEVEDTVYIRPGGRVAKSPYETGHECLWRTKSMTAPPANGVGYKIKPFEHYDKGHKVLLGVDPKNEVSIIVDFTSPGTGVIKFAIVPDDDFLAWLKKNKLDKFKKSMEVSVWPEAKPIEPGQSKLSHAAMTPKQWKLDCMHAVQTCPEHEAERLIKLLKDDKLDKKGNAKNKPIKKPQIKKFLKLFKKERDDYHKIDHFRSNYMQNPYVFHPVLCCSVPYLTGYGTDKNMVPASRFASIDRVSMPPAIIFRGMAYEVEWCDSESATAASLCGEPLVFDVVEDPKSDPSDLEPPRVTLSNQNGVEMSFYNPKNPNLEVMLGTGAEF